jgi:hypothetical protein
MPHVMGEEATMLDRCSYGVTEPQASIKASSP